ncbi:MAG: LarC family nickel insertion protein [Geminicoccaceae bacterium]
MKHIHLEPIGGVAGDMFVASLLDAWPDLAEATIAAVRAAGLGDDVDLEHLAYHDDVLTGSRFAVRQQRAATVQDGPGLEGPGAHQHVHWRSLRQRLSDAPLPAGVGDRAITIFSLLAEAEAGVHGVPVDEATFHEVGAWDSIADIVAAAFLIETIGDADWSVGPLPLGSGRVRCAHGELPVPAPATMRLLEGFVFHDDGRPGERVTPTGAAILKYLQPGSATHPGHLRLLRTGYGFGLRKLDGMSNVLRASVFEPVGTMASAHDEVGVISFEIDDQTAEDLAIGLDHLRRRNDVLDIVQMPGFGKKGRMVTSLRLLVRPKEAIEAVIEACFRETTTLGVRWAIEKRTTLERHVHRTEIGTNVKLAERPDGGLTAKAESNDLASLPGHQTRQDRRREAETESMRQQELERGA